MSMSMSMFVSMSMSMSMFVSMARNGPTFRHALTAGWLVLFLLIRAQEPRTSSGNMKTPTFNMRVHLLLGFVQPCKHCRPDTVFGC